MKKVMPVLLISFCLSAFYSNAQDNLSTEGDKVVKEITTAPFETIITEGGGNFYFHYSPNPKVEIKGTDSCVETSNVQVLSNVLNISQKEGFSENCRPEIHIYTPVIKEIQQNGGGRIVIKEGFAPVDVFKCSIDGGGELSMEALKVNSLLASINGGGVIYYQGNPSVESDISGGGVVRRR